MEHYPRALYRPGKGPSEVWGELVDTRIVASVAEERTAVSEGWLLEPQVACNHAKKARLRKELWKKFAQHWQFWVSTTIALAALIVGFLAIK